MDKKTILFAVVIELVVLIALTATIFAGIFLMQTRSMVEQDRSTITNIVDFINNNAKGADTTATPAATK